MPADVFGFLVFGFGFFNATILTIRLSFVCFWFDTN